MSITSNFPAIKPTLLLDFANTKQLDPRITFTRASTATYYGTQTAKAEENLLLQSQDFTTTWANTATTDTGNTEVAPDGTTTADTIADTAATSAHDISQTITSTANATYVYSCFLKNGTRQYAILASSISTNSWASAKFDLSAGTAGSTSSAGAAYSSVSSTITSVGNSWYRCTLTFTVNTSTTLAMRVGLATDGTTFTAGERGLQSYLGDGSTIFAWGAQLEQRSAVTAYTPTTTQTITNYIPQLLTAASGVARFDNNPTTFESLGLLIEESRTNSELYSEDFANAHWSKNNSTVSSNVISAPDGNLTGDKLITDSGLTDGQAFSAVVLTASTTFTFSCFAKAGEWSWVNLATRGPENIDIGAFFNLSAGTVGTVSAGVTASITPVGNGWYRCAVTRTTGTGATASRQRIYSTNADNTLSTGNGYSGIYIWGAQLEAGAFATSYIPTVASQVTRAADAATMTGTNFSSWYNAGQGTLYAEANTPSFATTYVFADINNNSTTTYIRQSTASTGTNTQFVISDNSVTTASPGVIVTLGSYRRMAGAYTADSVQQSVNGFLGTEDTSSIIPSGLVQMNIGARSSGASPVNGTIKKIAYYPLRVTNAQLQGLTS